MAEQRILICYGAIQETDLVIVMMALSNDHDKHWRTRRKIMTSIDHVGSQHDFLSFALSGVCVFFRVILISGPDKVFDHIAEMSSTYSITSVFDNELNGGNPP
ncbi:hypothetical protein VNO77_17380 [Canavalia gladiata]|uniref:Uncharacterized protein n=1 Tax=Canavalia gladiata TaxID=3824 RepID=A0AAN9QGK1_CANGL